MVFLAVKEKMDVGKWIMFNTYFMCDYSQNEIVSEKKSKISFQSL